MTMKVVGALLQALAAKGSAPVHFPFRTIRTRCVRCHRVEDAERRRFTERIDRQRDVLDDLRIDLDPTT
jgi:hypothetical protein